MKALLFFYFLLCIHYGFAQQDSLQIELKWIEVKKDLQNEVQFISEFEEELLKSKLEKGKIKELINAAHAVQKCLVKAQSIDSITISQISDKSNTFRLKLYAILISIDSEESLTKKQKYIDFQSSLEGYANRFMVAVYKFNETCLKFKRPALLIKLMSPEDSTKIEF